MLLRDSDSFEKFTALAESNLKPVFGQRYVTMLFNVGMRRINDSVSRAGPQPWLRCKKKMYFNTCWLNKRSAVSASHLFKTIRVNIKPVNLSHDIQRDALNVILPCFFYESSIRATLRYGVEKVYPDVFHQVRKSVKCKVLGVEEFVHDVC